MKSQEIIFVFQLRGSEEVTGHVVAVGEGLRMLEVTAE